MTTSSTPPPLDDAGEAARGALGWLLGAPLQTVVTIVLGVVVLAVARWVIARGVRSVIDGGSTVRAKTRTLLLRTRVGSAADQSNPLAVARRVQRAETMGSVLRSVAALVVGILVLTALANIYGWQLGPLLASAGVAGVALGFGAQTLVKDFLSGLFMLIEDQYGVGDVVNLGEATGTVEAVGLRVTQVRSLDGTLWYVRNGEILRVGNMTQGWSRALVEVLVPPDMDVQQAADLLLRATREALEAEDLAADALGDPEVTTYESLSAESVMIRMLLKTVPAKQWAIQRAVRGRVRELFRSEGVDLALPRREVLVEREAQRPGDAGHDPQGADRQGAGRQGADRQGADRQG
ncbi:mechanosensitive ion channel family protein [Cellulomonas carbonis]|uniref:Mechanosensitive ion channel protein MscS n=2 Tax=Cellulomonas carbonis TaxID=1386092 RepID=A0A0A0BMH1_9CELL|nr:mechanosensitive ion channel family protein [Cellulomonas carbonis]KGM09156.1 mechanosensitive ion channel protein MscS [Cellulomonas carbonis T26]